MFMDVDTDKSVINFQPGAVEASCLSFFLVPLGIPAESVLAPL